MKLKNDNFDGIYHLKNEAYLEDPKEEKIEVKEEKPKKRARKKGEK